MDQLERDVCQAVEHAIQSMCGEQAPRDLAVELSRPPKRAMGDFSYPCFQLAKQLGRSPKELAEALVEQLTPPPAVGEFRATGPYLNCYVDRPRVAETTCNEIQSAGEAFGTNRDLADEVIMVEFSSPNTNKPQHLGHVRNNILGDSLARILDAGGARVIRANLVNDRGIHICKSLVAYEHWGQGVTPESSGQKGDHLVGALYVDFEKHFREEFETWADEHQDELAALGSEERDKRKESYFREDSPLGQEAQQLLRRWEAGDAEVLRLWETLRGWVMQGFEQTYREMDVRFDRYYFESETYQLGKSLVTEGLAKGVFEQRSDGAIVADLTEEGLGRKVLLRSDGTSVYITQDLGTAVTRHDEFGLTRCVYVVAREQEHHFRLLFRILEKLGYDWARGLFHRSYGMVHLTSGRMKSREGTVVDADDLLAELHRLAVEEIRKRDAESETASRDVEHRARQVSLAALKFYLLAVDPLHDITYKPEESIAFEGRTGPYVQYAHARICSILRKGGEAAEAETQGSLTLSGGITISDDEVDVLMQLRGFPEVVRQSAADYDPSRIAFYLFDLAKNFSQFYNKHHVLNAEDASQRAFRLALCAATAQVLRNGLRLLGIEAPREM